MNTLVIKGIYNAQNILIPTLLMAAAVLQPTHIQHLIVRKIQSPLVIQTSKDHPPRIALEEVLRSAKVDAPTNTQTVQNLNETATLMKWTVSAEKRILPKMIIQREAVSEPIQPVEQNQLAEQEWIQQLPPQQRNRILAANEKHKTLDQDWTPPNFKVLVQEKLEEIKAQETEKTDSHIYVAAKSANGQWVTPPQQKPQASLVEVRPDPIENPDKPTPAKFPTLAGLVRVNGLPSPRMAGNEFVFFREINGIPQEQGSINELGQYKISLQNPNIGTLVVQLVNDKKGVIGEGRLRLSTQQQSLAKNEILVERFDQSIAATYATFEKTLERTVLRSSARVQTKVLMTGLDNVEKETDVQGHVELEGVKAGSWTLLRSQAKSYYPGMQLVKSGIEKQSPLYREDMVHALQKIISEQKISSDLAENGSVVWGRVLIDGKPASGVRVEVEALPSAKASYLNALLIPDQKMKTTSENGYFIFTDLPAGLHSIKARVGKDYWAHGNVVVDEGTISSIDVETSNETLASSISVFDAFSGRAEMAEIEMQSLPQTLNVQGEVGVYLPKVHRLGLINVKPNNERYVETTQTYDDMDESIYIPLIEEEWIKRLRDIKKMNLAPDTSIIVGFVQNEGFDVYLPHVENYLKENVVYFDMHGQFSETAVAGGGFVMFNVPPGIQSVTLMGQQSQLVSTQIIPADPRSVSIVRFKF